MLPHIHYDANHVVARLPSLDWARIILATAAAQKLILNLFDAKQAYTCNLYDFTIIFYVKEPRAGDKPCDHGGTIAVLNGNPFGSPSGAYYFINGMLRKVCDVGSRPLEVEPCVLIKWSGRDYTISTVSLDDTLVAANAQTLVDDLFADLCKKDNLRRLGILSKLLGMQISFSPRS